jgi:hypothetical protein
MTLTSNGPRTSAPAPTAWAIKHGSRSAATEAPPLCHCGAALIPCAGCGQARCLDCDPYLSDDCRWSL